MRPVLVGATRQLPPPLDNEDAGITDIPRPFYFQLEALLKLILILVAVREPGAEKSESVLYRYDPRVRPPYLLDLALQMQQPSFDRYVLGLWYEDILLQI